MRLLRSSGFPDLGFGILKKKIWQESYSKNQWQKKRQINLDVRQIFILDFKLNQNLSHTFPKTYKYSQT